MGNKKAKVFTAEELFNKYLEETKLAGKIGHHQYTETKRAFYGGISATYVSIIEGGKSDSIHEQLDQLKKDCEEFWKDQVANM